MNNWRTDAACRGADTSLFFEDEVTNYFKTDRLRRALAFCGACPVKYDCLSWAVENDVQYGLFGGLTKAQRRAWARNERKVTRKRGVDVPCGSEAKYQIEARLVKQGVLDRTCDACRAAHRAKTNQARFGVPRVK